VRVCVIKTVVTRTEREGNWITREDFFLKRKYREANKKEGKKKNKIKRKTEVDTCIWTGIRFLSFGCLKFALCS